MCVLAWTTITLPSLKIKFVSDLAFLSLLFSDVVLCSKDVSSDNCRKSYEKISLGDFNIFCNSSSLIMFVLNVWKFLKFSKNFGEILFISVENTGKVS